MVEKKLALGSFPASTVMPSPTMPLVPPPPENGTRFDAKADVTPGSASMRRIMAGAVVGSMVAGYYLLRVYDMPITTYVAVALNVLVALLALAIANRTKEAVAVPEASAPTTPTLIAGARLVYVAIALSGLTALGAQVVWTRMLSLIFGATTYTFSLILAIFLTGLGIGSSLGAAIAKTSPNPP